MSRMEMFLLWATLGVYGVGVVAVVLAALLFVATGGAASALEAAQ